MFTSFTAASRCITAVNAGRHHESTTHTPSRARRMASGDDKHVHSSGKSCRSPRDFAVHPKFPCASGDVRYGLTLDTAKGSFPPVPESRWRGIVQHLSAILLCESIQYLEADRFVPGRCLVFGTGPHGPTCAEVRGHPAACHVFLMVVPLSRLVCVWEWCADCLQQKCRLLLERRA